MIMARNLFFEEMLADILGKKMEANRLRKATLVVTVSGVET